MPQPAAPKKGILSTLKKLTQSNILKNFFIYSFGSLLVRGISILLAPITMSILDPSDYGMIALANSFVGIFTVFLGLGLRQAFSLEYFHCDNKKRKIMINNMIMLYLMISIPILIFFSFWPSIINKIVFVNKASNNLIILSLTYSFLFFFVEFFYQVLTYREEALKIILIQTSVALLTISLNLIFLCWFKLGVISLMAGQAIGLMVVFFIGLHSYCRKSCYIYFTQNHYVQKCGTYLKLGLPFVPGVLCGWILASSDRWVLAQYSTMHDVGIYSLAGTFGQLFQMLILFPMTRAYVPAVLEKFSKNKKNLLSVEKWNQKNMIISMIGLAIIISVGYLVCKPILQMILPERYQPAIGYIWMILMGYVFLLGEHFASIFVIFHKKASFQAFSLAIPSILNLFLNILLVPSFNITGCVFSTLFAYIAYFIIKISYNIRLQKTVSQFSE